jgi:DNA modification methylase
MDWLNRCHIGDVRAVLRQMIAAGVKVNCIVTSPPYWGLRSYLPEGHAEKVHELGSEPTLAEFLANMTEVFNLAREVLADDGTAWVNMGESYAGSWGAQSAVPVGEGTMRARQMAGYQRKNSHAGSLSRTPGLKPKDLVGQAWRLAFALQDGTCRCSACGQVGAASQWPRHNGLAVCIDCLMSQRLDAKVLPHSPGWWLRQDIVWHKPNPMPESIRDRCTKAHEYLFLLAKSERYYYDFEAMQEPVNGGAKPRGSLELSNLKRPGFGHGYDEQAKPRYKTPDGWATHAGAHGSFHRDGREKIQYTAVGQRQGPPGNPSPKAALATSGNDGAFVDGKDARMGRGAGWRERERKLAEADSGTKNNDSMDAALLDMRTTRNRRSVWTIPSAPYKGSHFATFPPALVEPCILAGCPAGGTVLDIFMGSGTTAQVAQRLGRNWIGIDLDERNLALQAGRIAPQLAMVLAA